MGTTHTHAHKHMHRSARAPSPCSGRPPPPAAPAAPPPPAATPDSAPPPPPIRMCIPPSPPPPAAAESVRRASCCGQGISPPHTHRHTDTHNAPADPPRGGTHHVTPCAACRSRSRRPARASRAAPAAAPRAVTNTNTHSRMSRGEKERIRECITRHKHATRPPHTRATRPPPPARGRQRTFSTTASMEGLCPPARK